MWDPAEFDEAADDWQPLVHRRPRLMRIVAIVVVVAMVLALVIPVLLRTLREDEPVDTGTDGVRAAVVERVRR